MYDTIEYEDILERMLDRVPDSMDKREGSVLYDAIAPAAMEIKLMYMEFDAILEETFADSAPRDYLVRRAAERGLKPTPATKAILKGEFNINVPIGSRFNNDELNYIVVEKITELQYKVACETDGTVGNKRLGTIVPIEYIDGLETAQLTELLVPGEDEEDTEEFRKRYFNSFDSKAYGGNIADYLEKTNSLNGVGSTKVTPIWDGPGTVKLTILDSQFGVASSELVRRVQEEICPNMQATGVGIAPIGHKVTVESAEGVVVNIGTSLVFDEGYSFETTEEAIKEKVEEYLLSIRKNWSEQTNGVVRIAQIESKIMSVKGVIDISGTTINGVAENLTVTNYQVPTIGVITNA